MEKKNKLTEEELRLLQVGGYVNPWEKWGPYVSERAWGTVREDYSHDGNAWHYVDHEKARSKAFRWGEDGIAGICDRYQVMTLSFAFWNEKDRILKERLYGLSLFDGNHGEDVKELYFYLDNTPSHSYMKYLYKYPQSAFPYEKLVEENHKRNLPDLEYELIDSGIFDENRYFDIFIEYAKLSHDDIGVIVEVHNRGPDPAPFHLLPQLTFRNVWAWEEERKKEPVMKEGPQTEHFGSIIADDSEADHIQRLNFEYQLGPTYFYYDRRAEALFTNNESNREVLYGEPNPQPYVKDAFHRHVVNGEACLNPEKKGTRSTAHFKGIEIPAGGKERFIFRLCDSSLETPLDIVERMVKRRKAEADEFYEKLHGKSLTDEEKMIQRQAFSGMLWSKQIYLYDVHQWLLGDNTKYPPPKERETLRNHHWKHLISKRILSMPDKWEYPWFAAWDLAFQSLTFALLDIHFAKDQLWYLLFDQFQHPNGQVPAYEWEFSELNPPVQAWAAYKLYEMEFQKTGEYDRSFLKRCFHKLILNFVWWVNKVDSQGNNVFEGGFLGLDNITVIDRSEELPGGGKLEQSDGTGWMGLFCLTLMRIALELAKTDPDYESMAVKFFEHYVYISNALEYSVSRGIQLWNEEDGFFYDVIRHPDGNAEQIQVRSLVGIIPLYTVDCVTEEEIGNFKEFAESFRWFISNRKDLVEHCVTPIEEDGKKRYVLTLMSLSQMQRVLYRVWDPNEFRSEYGLRSLSKYYQDHPYTLFEHTISYEPGESQSYLKGGNSNWRGPIWFPTNFLLIEALKKIYQFVGDRIVVQNEGEEKATTKDMARYFARALIKLFKKDKEGKRAFQGDYPKFSEDQHFKDHLLFYEHFHGDDGRGLGACHQTGWTGLVANLLDEWID